MSVAKKARTMITSRNDLDEVLSFYAQGIDTQQRLICYLNNPSSHFLHVAQIQSWSRKNSSFFQRCLSRGSLEREALLESTLQAYKKKVTDLKQVEYLDLQQNQREDHQKVCFYFSNEFVIVYKKVVKALEILDFPFSLEPKRVPYLTSRLALDVLTKNMVEEKTKETLLFETDQSSVYQLNLCGFNLVRKHFRHQKQHDQIGAEYKFLLNLNDDRFPRVAHASSTDLYLNFFEAVTFRAACLTIKEGFDSLLQVLSALEFLHLNKISHQDIHPENILISSDHRKVFLIDFASATPLCEVTRKEDLDCFGELISFWILENEEKLPKEVYKNLESFSNTIKGKDFLICYHQPYEVIKQELTECYQEYQAEFR